MNMPAPICDRAAIAKGRGLCEHCNHQAQPGRSTCESCTLNELYLEAQDDKSRIVILKLMLEWLTKSYECYVLAGPMAKPMEAWDDYDVTIGPGWRQAVKLLKTIKHLEETS